MIPVVIGNEIKNGSSYLQESLKITNDPGFELAEFDLDIWTKRNPFIERTNPLSSFDAFYRDVDVILIQADFADSWEAKKKNIFQIFNQFKREHYKEIQTVLKLLPEISKQGHDPAPLIVFQKINHYRGNYGEIESSSRFDSLLKSENWYVDEISNEDIDLKTLAPEKIFEWKNELIRQKKGKHVQVRVEPEQKKPGEG